MTCFLAHFSLSSVFRSARYQLSTTAKSFGRMSHDNRIEQLEDLKNIETNADFYERLAAGKIATTADNASSLSTNGKGFTQPYYIPVPITIKSQLGSPTALAIGAFSTTLTTLSFALMGFRGVGVTNAFIGNFFGVAGIGMVGAASSLDYLRFH